jgi:restriction system protein
LALKIIKKWRGSYYMAIPDYQTVMLPLLKFLADSGEHSLREAIDALADEFALTEAERTEMLASGQQATFNNRVGWARTYLKKAGLLESTRRSFFRITDRGTKVLTGAPSRIDVNFLEQFEEFVQFRSIRREKSHSGEAVTDATDQTPEESLESAYQKLREGLASEILQITKSRSPAFFEQLVVDLLVKMGYGGSRREAGQALGKSGDGGIDGIIKEDKLGLDIIYIQAKRWDGSVGRPEVQKSAGALQGQRAKKGIFITTSAFTKEAIDYATFIDSKIILIDGARLAEFMIDHGVGVTTQTIYEIKKIDSDYFTEG